jgi:hypothetical protein
MIKRIEYQVLSRENRRKMQLVAAELGKKRQNTTKLTRKLDSFHECLKVHVEAIGKKVF